MDEPINQSMVQKKIAFANNPDMVEAALQIIRELAHSDGLVGGSEYQTVVNAVKMDTQLTLLNDFIMTIDRIKNGDLLTTASNG